MMIAGRTTLRGLRWHEKQGLLGDVERSGGNHRRYTPEHIRRAKIIAACQMCGWSLFEIKHVVSHYDPAVRSNITAALREKIREAKTLMAGLPFADEPELDL
jgi:DNA-binding transcriptional MerR regulator